MRSENIPSSSILERKKKSYYFQDNSQTFPICNPVKYIKLLFWFFFYFIQQIFFFNVFLLRRLKYAENTQIRDKKNCQCLWKVKSVNNLSNAGQNIV